MSSDPMNASTFLDAFFAALKKNARLPPATENASDWTSFMTNCLCTLADETKMHLCGRRIPKSRACRSNDPVRHMPNEFHYDFTLYADGNWNWCSLPSVIIEHENQWSQHAFFQDFWKILAGFAPLRVMFGYAKDKDHVETLAASIRQKAHDDAWQYPAESEDLVLLRCPIKGGMDWPKWRVLHRPRGGSWKTPTDQVLFSTTSN